MHTPVLTKEVLKYLSPKPNENFVDCTVGEGGHANLILEKTAPNGRILGIDLDAEQIKKCAENTAIFGNRIILENNSYANLAEIVKKNNFSPVNGILADLGFSSRQIEESGRGFSFSKDEPLDMRYNTKFLYSPAAAGPRHGETNDQFPNLTAKEIVNNWSEEELERILKEYGEERFARGIAKKIVLARKEKPILTTVELVFVIGEAAPYWYQRGKIHYATKTFQALRLAVNGELENLEKFLPQAIDILESSGRLAVISFHSLEDRLVKNFFREKAKEGKIKILTKKPVIADGEEIIKNRRARSAKLRAVIKI